jgi:ComF family protein
MATIARSLTDALLEVLYPRSCLLSGVSLYGVQTRVPDIADEALDAHVPAAPSDELTLAVMRHVGQDDLFLRRVHARFAVMRDSTIDRALWAIKYHGRTDVAEGLGHELGATLAHILQEPLDMVMPVPIHTARQRERGYNQSECIARGVIRALEEVGLLRTAPTPQPMLERIRNTPTQTARDAWERQQNMADAFRAQRLPYGVQRVLLIDDVITTGATMNACAAAILSVNPAVRIDGAALAAAA